jgi:hypothetical protein
MHQEYIEIRGARENNLKNVSLRIPQDHDLQNDVSHLSTITFHRSMLAQGKASLFTFHLSPSPLRALLSGVRCNRIPRAG